MALKTLNEIRGLQDPLKQSQAEFIITSMPGMALASMLQKISPNSACADGENIRLRCRSFSYPTPKIQQSEVVIGNFIRRRGSFQDKSGKWKCKVTENQDGSILNIIQAWCDLIHNNVTGTTMPSISYVGTAQVILGGDVMNDKRTVWLRGFYPIGYSVSEIDPNSSNPIEIDIEFSYDYFAENSYSLFTLF